MIRAAALSACLAGLSVCGLAQAGDYPVGPAGPYQTLQAAIDAAMASNTGGNAVILLPAGSWLGASISGPTPGAGGAVGRGYIDIRGAGPGLTTIRDNIDPKACGAIIATNQASVIVESLKIETSPGGCPRSSLFVQNGAVVQIGRGVEFGAAADQHMHAEAHGMIEAAYGYSVSGGARNHWAVSTGGYIEIDPVAQAIAFLAPVQFQVFAWAQSTGVILFGATPAGDGAKFVDAENVSAPFRYTVRSNAVIDLNDGKQPLPGAAREVQSGGQYVNGP